MKNTHARKVIIIILAVVILFGAAGAAIWRFMPQEEDNTADPFALLSEGFTDRKIVDEDSALAAIEDVAQVLGIENVNAEFSNCEVNTVFSNTYYRFQQEYKGIPAYGRSVIVAADKDGNSLSLSGNYINTQNINISPQIDEISALEIAQQYYGGNAELSSEGLTVYSIDNNIAELSWKIFVNSDKIMEWCFISAINGELLAQNSLLYTDIVRGTGEDIDGELKEFNTLFNTLPPDNSIYSLEDEDRNIHVFNADKKTLMKNLQKKNDTYTFDLSIRLDDMTKVPLVPLTNMNSVWKDTKAVTSMERASTAYDFFSTILNRKGFNGKNGRTNIVYNDYMKGDTINAYSNGGKTKETMVLSFGMDNSMGYDVFGHEFTHAVEQSISGLLYEGESGALMEAYSDIFGEILEDWQNGKGTLSGDCDWIQNAIRNLASPTSIEHQVCYYEYNGETCPLKEQDGSHIQNDSLTFKEGISCQVMRPANPDYYQGEAWCNTVPEYNEQGETINDYGGVHTNSTVISHAAYLMSKGIDGTDAFEPLSTEELAKLFYETLYTLPSDCTFSQFRALVQNTARYQDLSDKQRSCVSNAFFQVGITPAAMPAMKDHLSVEIYDIKGLIYDNYTLYVQHGNSEQKYSGEDINEQGLTFPESGEYRLRIVDNANTDNETIVSVTAVDHGGVEKMPIFTRCGLSKVDDLIGLLETDEEELSSIDYNNLVTEAYTETYTDEFGTYIWRIPEIMLSGDDIESINNEIWETLFTGAVSQNHEGIQQGGTFVAYDVIDYTWAVNGNILSLVTTTNASTMSWTDYYVYNVDITTGRELSRDTLLNTYGYSYDEYNKLAEQVLGSKFWSTWDRNNENFQDDDFISWFNEALEKTISQENIDQSFPYINDKGELCIIAKVYSLAGADYYWNNLNMVNFTLVPDYATPVESNTHTNNASGKGWREAYESTLLQHPESTPFTYGSKTVYFDTEYTLYDIDKNEIPELIVKEDTDKYYIYSFDETGIVSYDMNFWNYDKCLYEYQENGIIVYDGGMGSMRIEYVSLYSIENNELERVKTLISTEEHSFDELYSFLDDLTPIDDFHPITDHSYLFN